MYSFETKIRYSEVDSEERLKKTALVDLFQDCSAFQSESLGRGIDFLLDRHRAWIINSWQIVWNRIPKFGEEVVVSTWPYDFRRCLGYRHFSLQTKEGEMLVYANSLWTYLDTERLMPARLPEEEQAAYELGEKIDIDWGSRKIALPENMTAGEPFVVVKSNIDTNNHVNNGRYVAFAEEYLPDDFPVKQMRVEYRKAAVLHDVIYPYYKSEGTQVYVSLADENGKPYAVVTFDQTAPSQRGM